MTLTELQFFLLVCGIISIQPASSCGYQNPDILTYLRFTKNYGNSHVFMETIAKPAFSVDQIKMAYYLIWIAYPILLACCTVGNILNLIVLAKEKDKASTNCYMTAVAVSDLLTL